MWRAHGGARGHGADRTGQNAPSLLEVTCPEQPSASRCLALQVGESPKAGTMGPQAREPKGEGSTKKEGRKERRKQNAKGRNKARRWTEKRKEGGRMHEEGGKRKEEGRGGVYTRGTRGHESFPRGGKQSVRRCSFAGGPSGGEGKRDRGDLSQAQQCARPSSHNKTFSTRRLCTV